jgi:hypothetical protein
MESQFEWDEDKARRNLANHKVSFAEGATVFNDLFIGTMPDTDHSDDEQRRIAIGRSIKGRVLVVIYTERGDKTRIISCRKAIRSERIAYEEGNF